MHTSSSPSSEEYKLLLRHTITYHLMTRLNTYLNEECGLLPDDVKLLGSFQILDVACGTGQWVCEAARHTRLVAIGIDAWKDTVSLAQGYGYSLSNAYFMHMNLSELDDFPDQSFDLIHLSLLAFLVDVQGWQNLLGEVWRICRPGGLIVWREAAFPSTNSAACASLTGLLSQALEGTGKTTNILHRMEDLLGDSSEAPWKNVRRYETSLAASLDAPLHRRLSQGVISVVELLPRYLKEQIAGRDEDIDDICFEAAIDVMGRDFQGSWEVVTVVGEKVSP